MRPRGFTLVELLVVLFIVALVSAVTIPPVLNAVSHRQVTEAASMLQAALVGARDEAIKANAPRGIRLLPDPGLTIPAPNDPGVLSVPPTKVAGEFSLAWNRIIPIEPAPDYTSGAVSIAPSPYTYDSGVAAFDPSASNSGTRALFVFQAVIDGSGLPNETTNWYYNIRVGDRLRFNDAGNYYTVVGPDLQSRTLPNSNPEGFVNIGPPGTTPPTATDTTTPEFLILVNGMDDNGNGYVDEGFDGIDNDLNRFNDDTQLDPMGNLVSTEWEQEAWLGPQFAASLSATGYVSKPYTIVRRPVPKVGGRKVLLPQNVVIDGTGLASPWTQWVANNASLGNAFLERSRLPMNGLYADIMLNPSGQAVPTTIYSSPASVTIEGAFYHFWITERIDVHEITELWGSSATKSGVVFPNANPNASATPAQNYLLPLPTDTYLNAGLTAPTITLTGERSLVTLFARNGAVVINSLYNFSPTDVNAPYYAAQTGQRDTQ